MYVIATAGHVDHGKSTLVRALTGMEPDRWAEEHRRGMTIDLGYAWMGFPARGDSAGGGDVAFVDVPGHQRFVSNMLAGIGPVPAVLLIVAADDGWGRQSTEHLAALDALGVRHGLLVISRCDLAEPELAVEEARTYLEGTSLASIRSVAVSAKTGEGMGTLVRELAELVRTVPEPSLTGTRLWVDRVFTVRGVGTVVTGTLGSGEIRVDDRLLLASTGAPVHVRGIEELRQSVSCARAVARVALNLRGVKRPELRRGDALVSAGDWLPVTSVDVRLVTVTAKIPRQPLVHVGSAEIAANFRSLGTDHARLTWATPLPIRVGERLLLRDPGPQRVIAGAVVLDVAPPSLARRGSRAHRTADLTGMPGTADATGELRRRGAVRRSELCAAGHLDPAHRVPGGTVEHGDWLVHPKTWAGWAATLRAALDRRAETHPLSPGLSRTEVADAIGAPDLDLVDAVIRCSDGIVSDSSGVHRYEAGALLPDQPRAALNLLLTRLDAAPFDAADAETLAALGLTKQHLAVAIRSGELIAVGAGIFLRPEAIERATAVLGGLTQPFTVSEARKALHTTRRVAMPLLELLDTRRITERIDSSLRAVR